jgi:hypothetical protein
MITLTVLIVIWGSLSIYRIHKESKKEGVSFNPFYGSFIDYMGFMVSIAMAILTLSLLLSLIIKYLP